MHICPRCQFTNEGEMNYCPRCGSVMVLDQPEETTILAEPEFEETTILETPQAEETTILAEPEFEETTILETTQPVETPVYQNYEPVQQPTYQNYAPAQNAQPNYSTATSYAPTSYAPTSYAPTPRVVETPKKPSLAKKIVGMALSIEGFSVALIVALYGLIFLAIEPAGGFLITLYLSFLSLPGSIVGLVLSTSCANQGDESAFSRVGKGLGLAGVIVVGVMLFITFVAMLGSL